MDRKTIFFAFVALLLTGMATSCKDFFEPDLENRKVVLLAPADGHEADQYVMGFWWEPVEDALYYRLQVVTQDFTAPGSLITDTLITGLNKFNMTLDPGRYQWRVRAENGSSKTGYTASGFVIHESSIEQQRVILSLPGNNYLSNQAAVQLKWNSLFGADLYRLQIDTSNFADEATMVYNNTLTDVNYAFTFPKEGVFKWRVRGEDATVQSKWSDTFSMTFDLTPPGKVTAVAPANGTVVSKPVTLQWMAVTTAKKYKLYAFKNSSTAVYSPAFPLVVNGTSYIFDLGEPGEIVYWRVSAIDEAGNEGELSEEMSFTLQ